MSAALAPLAPDARDALVRAVQANCDIADARHAGELTLCTYLLQMREFYRWERAAPLRAELPRAAVGAWIAAKEAAWSELAAREFQALPLGDARIDPMDAVAVNRCLRATGLLYGAGLVTRERPVFFLAELHGYSQRAGLAVQQGAREHARGLAAPPAALAGGGAGPIVVRRDALARWCVQRYEVHRLRPAPGSALAALVHEFGLDGKGFDAGLERWLDVQVEISVLHELGEHAVGQTLGAPWQALRASLPTRRGELHALALRDLLADLGTTLPALLQGCEAAWINAWFAGFDGTREALHPGLARAARVWRASDDVGALHEAVARGQTHFESLASQALALHARGVGGAAVEALLCSPAAVCPG